MTDHAPEAIETFVKMRLKHVAAIFVGAFLLASGATWGYFELYTTANNAAKGVLDLTIQLDQVRCLIQQKNNYDYYGIVPQKEC